MADESLLTRRASASFMSTYQTETQSQVISNAVRGLLEDGLTGALATLMDSPKAESNDVRVGAKLLVKESGDTVGGLGHDELDNAVTQHSLVFLRARDDAKTFRVVDFAPQLEEFSGALVLFERIEAEPRLVIAGAGHVGASLARLAALVGYRVTLIDDRAEFVARELFASPNEQSIELIAAKSWSNALREAIASGHGVSVAIVTRGHKQDEDCLQAAIGLNPDYIGMIGSKRRTNFVLDKLREEGADEDRLKRVRAPIGLDIGAVSPEEVALAILAEIVAERRRGSGAPLSAWRRA
jgi:xanthine/CO dehydrogenase XdhC/CoxF family maturation factor